MVGEAPVVGRVASLLFLGLVGLPLAAEPGFLTRSSELLGQGKIDEAARMAEQILEASPDDPDALVVEGTVVLYRNLHPRRDDSIFRPLAEPAGPRAPGLDPSGAAKVAAWWKRVPGVDPGRASLWGDLAQLTFRAGDPAQALEFAAAALDSPIPDPEALQVAASVFLLNLDTTRGIRALEKIPGNRTALLYKGLEAWRLGKDGWRVSLQAFVDGQEPGPGTKLAAYLLGPDMRDTEAGFLEAIKTENSVPTLIVRQKYTDRYPNKFLSHLELARSLSQFGSFGQALREYAEIDRKALASTPEERQAVLFHQAWAYQASGLSKEASRLWEMVADSRDFYLRSAAAWFLGQNAIARGEEIAAKGWWSKVADEPARSKYAFWAAEELKKLP